MREAYAAAFASVFSEEEMQALADFSAGPGKQMTDGNAAMVAQQGEIRGVYERALKSAAHDGFCARRACGGPAELNRVWRPAEGHDGRLDNPQWVGQPSSYTISRAAPALAAASGVTGVARLACRIAKEGGLEACVVEEQLPVGLGFGEAALSLAGAYHLSAIQLADGGAGRKVTVRVAFPAPPPADAVKAPAARSPEALELGRQLVAFDDANATIKRDLELRILKFESPRPKTVDDKIYDEAIAAYRAAGEAALAAGRDRTALAWASSYDVDQLTALVAFRATPAAKAQRERQEALGVAFGKAMAFVGETITAEARAAFCATRGCDRGPPLKSLNLQPDGTGAGPSPAKP